MKITQNVTVSGSGLWQANTIPADFMRGKPSYSPDLDPRLPKHTTITANLIAGNSAVITVSDITIFPDPDLLTNMYGAVRVKQEVILYTDRWLGNATLTGLTRSVGNTTLATTSGNVTSGTLISSLGLRTLSS
jgi:hypothetical protein